ncbi:dicarboxylate/amino acid:cation symporter [Nonomuraea soli]|uniref:Na+/H+-dicarboxylate symporter n=1 Tax=Nonomuraea soli TaxID=1032476 RepID=A0A7W0CEF3_9ACTN|nr:dicarboxylate/amino acid:cation symporter [Nonomuraea soli]MBA2889663.1 Na+/H+-dicarboxylate symporter [Nonomuraea soli]
MKRLSFSLQLLLGLVAGVAMGLVARTWDVSWLAATLTQVGAIFVQLLKLAVPPLVFTAIVVSIANLRNVGGAARLAGKTLLWFLITALVAVAFAIALGLIINPGQGVTLDLGKAEAVDLEGRGTWFDFLVGIVPTNIFTAFSEPNVLQIVFLAVVFGAAAIAVGEKAEPFLNLTRSVLELIQKALWWVIRLAPIGTAALIGKSIANYGWDLLAPFAKLTAGVYIGCAIVLVVIYPVLLRVFGKVSPLQFYKKIWPAFELAFVSRSSVGTLPLTQRVAIERLGVDRDYASFAVPFGATTKMDGCASVYPALAAIFIAQIFGVQLGVGDYLLIALVSVIGSAATAGLTGAIVMLSLTLTTLGLPLEGVGLLLAIDPILDMIRTATNVTGQLVVPVIVGRSEDKLDDSVYDAPPQDLDDAPSEPVNTRTTEPALA